MMVKEKEDRLFMRMKHKNYGRLMDLVHDLRYTRLNSKRKIMEEAFEFWFDTQAQKTLDKFKRTKTSSYGKRTAIEIMEFLYNRGIFCEVKKSEISYVIINDLDRIDKRTHRNYLEALIKLELIVKNRNKTTDTKDPVYDIYYKDSKGNRVEPPDHWIKKENPKPELSDKEKAILGDT